MHYFIKIGRCIITVRRNISNRSLLKKWQRVVVLKSSGEEEGNAITTLELIITINNNVFRGNKFIF